MKCLVKNFNLSTFSYYDYSFYPTRDLRYFFSQFLKASNFSSIESSGLLINGGGVETA